LSDREVLDIKDMMSESSEVERPKVDFTAGEMVKIKDGPFENFDGKIESIDADHGKLRLSVSIFGRSTPVEVGYWQVEREG
jgi:transcriptional antiterminator NusG